MVPDNIRYGDSQDNGFSKNYENILSRIKEISKDKKISPVVIAVSKNQSVEAIKALYCLGHRDFGENYAQQLEGKAKQLLEIGCEGIRWHFIGHLQTNKVKVIAPWVYAVHTVDSLRLASEISKKCSQDLKCFIQVNIDDESSKSGILPQEAPGLAREISELKKLNLQGLMCIPDLKKSKSGEAFRELFELEKKCQPYTNGMLSMGMSEDFEVAMSEGATHLRLGRALFSLNSHSHVFSS